MGWRCIICEVDRATAERRKARKGERRLPVNASTCSNRCARIWYLRRQRERFGAGSGYRSPQPHGWTCAVCRRGLESAQRVRKRLGLGPLASNQKTCTPPCSDKFRRAAIHEGIERRKRDPAATRASA